MNDSIKKRLFSSLKKLFIMIAALLAYITISQFLKISIPCILRKVTGFYCPGCGTTRAFRALFNLNFNLALRQNIAVMLSLPVIAGIFVLNEIRYIKTGTYKYGKIQKAILAFIIAVLIVFGILRNLPAFSFLAPK